MLRHALVLIAVFSASTLAAGEIVQLSERTWDRAAPLGKEVDCIYGDFVLRNDKISVVIAKPVPTRHANLTIRDVGGAILDMTCLKPQNDQLGAYLPESRRFALQPMLISAGDFRAVYETPDSLELGRVEAIGNPLVFKCGAAAASGKPAVELTYTLRDGWDNILIETTYKNPHDQPIEVELIDAIRVDKGFDRVTAAADGWFAAYDKFWGQAYGVVGDGRTVQLAPENAPRAGGVLRFIDGESNKVKIAPGGDFKFARRVAPAANSLDVKAIAARLAEKELVAAEVLVRDAANKPIPAANVRLLQEGKLYAEGATNGRGQLQFRLPAGKYEVRVADLGRTPQTAALDTAQPRVQVALDEPGYVVGEVRSETGGPIPCKVQFIGKEGAANPYFGPDTAEYGVENLRYSPRGYFRQAMQPGKYEVIVSYGPEYDAVFTEIEVVRGQETPLRATLVRSVKTPGWVSADFHNHSSPSGDNTSSQLGRVLNLLCEHVEFAPCTEHARVDSYEPHLKHLGVEHLMTTCTGIELTGQPLPLNHQNAFPLVYKPRTQNGGGPETDADVEVQIARLALWDSRSEKLVQQNHPDIGNLFYDKNGDGQPDEGFAAAIPHMDVIEVHPLYSLFMPPVYKERDRVQNNTIFNWLQALNQGRRIPGVVNTDAHYNHHGSGFIRNYIKSKTDDPGKIEVMDMVRASERGNVIMTTGPYLEVALETGGDATMNTAKRAIPGEDASVPGGKATLHVRVQCPNWFDIDRVQVLLNGKPSESLNFTRDATPGRFASGVVKFDQRIPLVLERDTHVIVAALGEKTTLGTVMGPTYGKLQPYAVSNPIYCDVDGGGFTPNLDTLGAPLPVKAGTGTQK